MMTSFIMLVLEAEGRSNGNITLDLGRKIFAYRHGDDLWTHDGCHVGRFDPCTVRGCDARARKLARYVSASGRFALSQPACRSHGSRCLSGWPWRAASRPFALTSGASSWVGSMSLEGEASTLPSIEMTGQF